MRAFIAALIILMPAVSMAQVMPSDFSRYPIPTFRSFITQKGITSINNPPQVDTTLSTRFGTDPTIYKNPSVVAFAPGNMISFCPSMSCVTSPTNDHQRASLLVSATTQDDSHSEEQTLAVITTIDKGKAFFWGTSKSFNKGDNIQFPFPRNTVYRQVANACVTSSSGSGPTGTGTGIVDGSCVWDWINDQAINAKVGIYNEVKVMPGAGAAWAQANNYEIAPGTAPDFNINTEFDLSNHGTADCVIAVANCHNLYIRTNGKKVTSMVDIGTGNTDAFAAYWGLRLTGDYLASDVTIDVTTKGKIGLGFGATGIGAAAYTEATIRDNSNTPIGLDIKGTHTNAISIGGSISGAQIAGNNFIVFPDGGLRAQNYNVGTTPGVSCAGPPTSQFQVTNGIVTRC